MSQLGPPSVRAWGIFGLLSLIWGSSFLFIKIGLVEITPLMLVAFRISFGILFLFIVLRAQRLSLPKGRRLWGYFIIAGLFNTALPFVLIAWSETVIESALASILNGMTPLFSVLIAHFVLHDERITGAKAIGVILGFAGLIVIVGRNLQGGLFGNLVAELAVVAASISYAAASVFVRRTLRHQPATVLAVGQLGMADIFILAGLFAIDRPLHFPSQPLTWFSVVWLGILGSGVAYLLYFYLLKEIGASRTTMVTYVIPVVGVFLGIIVLHEALDWRALLGAIIAIGGVLLANRTKPPVAVAPSQSST